MGESGVADIVTSLEKRGFQNTEITTYKLLPTLSPVLVGDKWRLSNSSPVPHHQRPYTHVCVCTAHIHAPWLYIKQLSLGHCLGPGVAHQPHLRGHIWEAATGWVHLGIPGSYYLEQGLEGGITVSSRAHSLGPTEFSSPHGKWCDSGRV